MSCQFWSRAIAERKLAKIVGRINIQREIRTANDSHRQIQRSGALPVGTKTIASEAEGEGVGRTQPNAIGSPLIPRRDEDHLMVSPCFEDGGNILRRDEGDITGNDNKSARLMVKGMINGASDGRRLALIDGFVNDVNPLTAAVSDGPRLFCYHHEAVEAGRPFKGPNHIVEHRCRQRASFGRREEISQPLLGRCEILDRNHRPDHFTFWQQATAASATARLVARSVISNRVTVT